MCFRPLGEVDRSVEVTVDRMPACAGEDAIGQLQVGIAATADRAELARRVPAVGSFNFAAAPGVFVAQLAGEFGPGRVTDGLSEPMVSQHPGHVEVFEDEPVVGLDQRVGDLMQEVAADVGDTVMVSTQSGYRITTVV
jgi:hypothetical protein